MTNEQKPEQPPGNPDKDKKDEPRLRRTYEGLVEERIAKAVSDGLFSNLPGQGQPQRLDDDSLVPDGDRAGFRMLKANGFAPPWIEARRDVDEERARVNTWLSAANSRWTRTAELRRTQIRAEYQQKLQDLQRMILHYNLRAPSGVEHLRGLNIADELRKLGSE